jgi:pyrroline-5-carboxylate reductase
VIVESLVSELGPIMEVEEELINPMTALLGSGPAYVYVFMQAIIEAGRRLGVDPDLARLLSAQMIEGAARLAQHDQSTDLDGLIRQVVSPGGTTEAMLTALDQAAWSESLTDALLKAGERAVELGRYSA